VEAIEGLASSPLLGGGGATRARGGGSCGSAVAAVVFIAATAAAAAAAAEAVDNVDNAVSAAARNTTNTPPLSPSLLLRSPAAPASAASPSRVKFPSSGAKFPSSATDFGWKSPSKSPEHTPIAAANDAWFKTLRNGDLFGGCVGGVGGSGGMGHGTGASASAQSGGGTGGTREGGGYAQHHAEEALTLEALNAVSPGGGRMFSRGFKKMYLASAAPGAVSGNKSPRPSESSLVGVVGLSEGKHKEDLKRKAAVQPVSFHRSVVGRNAGYTGIPHHDPTKYPRAKGSPNVWVPGSYS
jgi:hypothetical protein